MSPREAQRAASTRPLRRIHLCLPPLY
jgi:hypothetical protein